MQAMLCVWAGEETGKAALTIPDQPTVISETLEKNLHQLRNVKTEAIRGHLGEREEGREGRREEGGREG